MGEGLAEPHGEPEPRAAAGPSGSLGNCGLRLRHIEEQQVFRVSAQWPHDLSQVAGPAQRRVSGPLGRFWDSEKARERRPRDRISFTRCISSDHHRQFVESRAGPADPILQMGSPRLRRFGDSSQATQKGRGWVLLPASLIPLRGEDVEPVALWG